MLWEWKSTEFDLVLVGIFVMHFRAFYCYYSIKIISVINFNFTLITFNKDRGWGMNLKKIPSELFMSLLYPLWSSSSGVCTEYFHWCHGFRSVIGIIFPFWLFFRKGGGSVAWGNSFQYFPGLFVASNVSLWQWSKSFAPLFSCFNLTKNQVTIHILHPTFSVLATDWNLKWLFKYALLWVNSQHVPNTPFKWGGGADTLLTQSTSSHFF